MCEEEEHGVEQMMEKANMGEEEQATVELKEEVVAKQEASTVVEVMSPEVEAELLDLVVSLGNVTCTFNVGCGLNLVELVLHGVNVEMKVAIPITLFISTARCSSGTRLLSGSSPIHPSTYSF